MNYIVIIFTIASTFIALFWLSRFAYRLRLTDVPNQRKIHKETAYLIGGIAMFIGTLVGILLSSFNDNTILYFILALFLVTSVGILDDIYNLTVKSRISVQIIVGFIMAEVAGVSLDSLGDLIGFGNVLLDNWSIPITIFSMIGIVNAVNFSDGIDGLSGSLSMVTFSSVAYLAFTFNSIQILQLSLIFIAALIPFLFVNLGVLSFSNKKIFMGDSGSMFLGLGIIWLLIDSSQGEASILAPVTALWIFAVPLIDAVSIILRRIVNGKSPFAPDNGHFHHLLRAIGYSDKAALVILILMSFVMASAGVWTELNNVSEWKMFAVFMIIFCGYFLGTMYAWKRIELRQTQ